MRLNYMTHSYAKPNHTQLPKLRRRTTVLGISALIFVASACGAGTSEDEAATEPPFLSAAENEQRSTPGGLAENDNSDPTAALGGIQQEAERIAGLSTSQLETLVDPGLESLFSPSVPQIYQVMPETAAGVEQMRDLNSNDQDFSAEHEVERFEQLRTQTTVEDVKHEVERIRQLAESTVG